MDIDKALYMKEFLELRNTLGVVVNKPANHVLYKNMYNEFMPRKDKIEIKKVVTEIQEKTIQIFNKKDVNKKKDESPEGALAIDKEIEVEKENESSEVVEGPTEESTEEPTEEPTEEVETTLFDDALDKTPNNDSDEEEDQDDDGADDGADEGEDDEKKEHSSKKIPISEEKVVEDVDLLGGGHQLKKIVINPNYVAIDK